MTTDEVLQRFHDTDADDWTQRNDAWIHEDAVVGEAVVCGGVFRRGVLRGGTFYGGEFHGGWYDGGVFRGGTFHGGEFRGGLFHGGEFHGGRFHGGEFCGGTFRAGGFRGGRFHGGEFRGGTFHGGWYYDGVFRDAPPLLTSMLPWPITIGAPGRIAVGCRCLTPDDWRRCAEQVLEDEGKYRDAYRMRILRVGMNLLPILEQWLQYNPNVVRMKE